MGGNQVQEGIYKSVLRWLGFFDLNFSLSYTAVFLFRRCSCFAFILREMRDEK